MIKLYNLWTIIIFKHLVTFLNSGPSYEKIQEIRSNKLSKSKRTIYSKPILFHQVSGKMFSYYYIKEKNLYIIVLLLKKTFTY